MPAARTSDPETSHAAARSAQNPTEVQQHILEVLRAQTDPRGLTDDDLYTAYSLRAIRNGWALPTPQSVRSRRAELKRSDRVRFSGHYGRTDTGRKSRRWVAVR